MNRQLHSDNRYMKDGRKNSNVVVATLLKLQLEVPLLENFWCSELTGQNSETLAFTVADYFMQSCSIRHFMYNCALCTLLKNKCCVHLYT